MSRPIGRPAASSATHERSRSATGSDHIRAAKDSASSSPSSRISARHLQTIASRLSDNDQAVLQFLAGVRLATGHQLARRLWSAAAATDTRARAARRALKRLEESRVIERIQRRVGGVRGGSTSIVYGVGPAGRRLLTRTGNAIPRLGTPGDRYVTHTLAITELAVGLHEAGIRGELDLIALQTEPDCWRPYLGVMGARMMLKPDLFVRLGVGAFEDRWFVEIDLATESGTTIQGKAQRYLEHFRSGAEQRRHGVYPRVVWTVPDHRRAEQIRKALSALPASAGRLFVVWPYAEVIGRLGAEANA